MMKTDNFEPENTNEMLWWGLVKVGISCKICHENFVEPPSQDGLMPGESSEAIEEQQWRFDIVEGYCPARQTCECIIDVFDNHQGYEPLRKQLWRLINETPNVKWVLTTSRPENIRALAPWPGAWPDNLALGVTVEDQPSAREKLPIMSCVPVHTKFVSAQRLRGPIDLSPWSDEISWVSTGVRVFTRCLSERRLFTRLNDSCLQANLPFFYQA